MPVHNGERYIQDWLDSLLQLTFIDIELIISDNASTDGTGDICREYAARDSRIRCFRESHNLGTQPNFELVLNESLGKYSIGNAKLEK